MLLFIVPLLFLMCFISNIGNSDLTWDEDFHAKTLILNHNDPCVFYFPDNSSDYYYQMAIFNNSDAPDSWDMFRATDANGPWTLFGQVTVSDQETPQWGRISETGEIYIYTTLFSILILHGKS